MYNISMMYFPRATGARCQWLALIFNPVDLCAVSNDPRRLSPGMSQRHWLALKREIPRVARCNLRPDSLVSFRLVTRLWRRACLMMTDLPVGRVGAKRIWRTNAES